MSRLREKFERELEKRGRSERTVHTCVASVHALTKYYRKSPDTIGGEEICHWLLHFVTMQRLAGSSVYCAVQAVRAFQEFVLGRARAATGALQTRHGARGGVRVGGEYQKTRGIALHAVRRLACACFSPRFLRAVAKHLA